MSNHYVNIIGRLLLLLVALALLACAVLPTPTPTPEPTGTFTPVPPFPTGTPTATPTRTPTPMPMVLPPSCIVPPVHLEVEATIQEKYPGAVVPREGALLFAVRFSDEGEAYLATFAYGGGAWKLIYTAPWDGEFAPTSNPTPAATPGAGREARAW